eukprot:3725175-Prymnesium_polylepis.3
MLGCDAHSALCENRDHQTDTELRRGVGCPIRARAQGMRMSGAMKRRRARCCEALALEETTRA